MPRSGRKNSSSNEDSPNERSVVRSRSISRRRSPSSSQERKVPFIPLRGTTSHRGRSTSSERKEPVRMVVPDSSSDNEENLPTDSEEEDIGGSMVNLERNYFKYTSKLESTNANIISQIVSFINLKDRSRLTAVSLSLRHNIRNTPIDLLSKAIKYKPLLRFLQANPDLKIIGLNIIFSGKDKDLSQIEPYLKNLTSLKLTNLDNNYDRQLFDYSLLSHCIQLITFSCDDEDFKLENLKNCLKLQKIKLSSTCEEKLSSTCEELSFDNFRELVFLEIEKSMFTGGLTSISLHKCKNLQFFSVKYSQLEKITMPKSNKLRGIIIMYCLQLDLSFLASCTQLEALVLIKTQAINTNILSSSLLQLDITNSKIEGDLLSLVNLKTLSLIEIPRLYILPKLPRGLVKFIVLNEGKPKKGYSMSELKECPNLRKLTIQNVESSINLDDIKYNTKIEDLSLRGRKITHLDTLSQCLNLTHLDIFSDMKQFDVSLNRNPLLNHVSLRMRFLDNISCLRNCMSLEIVTVSLHRLKDIQPLSTCINLRKVSLAYCKEVDDISSLERLPQLEIVTLNGTKLSKQDKKEFMEKTGVKVGHFRNNTTVMETPD